MGEALGLLPATLSVRIGRLTACFSLLLRGSNMSSTYREMSEASVPYPAETIYRQLSTIRTRFNK